MLAVPFRIILAQQIADATQSAHELSQSTAHHAMASTHTWLDVVLVAAGVIAVARDHVLHAAVSHSPG